VVVDGVVVVIIGLYLAAQPAMYAGGIKRLLPLRYRGRAGEVLGVLDEALGRWLIGRCGLMLVNGGLTAAGLWLLGMPLALTLGLLAGLLVSIFFGRGWKAFSKQRQLLRQDLTANALPLLAPLLSRQDAEIARLEGESASHRKLMMLVRRNSRSTLSRRNRVEIQQDAAVFYPSGETQGWFMALPAPRPIAVPCSWNDLFDDARDYLGLAWYWREVYVPSTWREQRVFLRIGSANYAAQVWGNGTVVAEHLGGHLPFVADVTKQVVWDRTNILAILVRGQPQPRHELGTTHVGEQVEHLQRPEQHPHRHDVGVGVVIEAGPWGMWITLVKLVGAHHAANLIAPARGSPRSRPTRSRLRRCQRHHRR
jgi:hypothetical protein